MKRLVSLLAVLLMSVHAGAVESNLVLKISAKGALSGLLPGTLMYPQAGLVNGNPWWQGAQGEMLVWCKMMAISGGGGDYAFCLGHDGATSVAKLSGSHGGSTWYGDGNINDPLGHYANTGSYPTFWNDVVQAYNYQYWIHNEVTRAWSQYWGTDAGPGNGWPPGRYISRYQGDSLGSCAPYPDWGVYADNMAHAYWDYWPDLTNAPTPTNAPNPSIVPTNYVIPEIPTNLMPPSSKWDASDEEWWQRFTNFTHDVTPPPATNQYGQDLTAVYDYLKQVRDACLAGPGNAGVAVENEIWSLRSERLAADVNLLKALGNMGLSATSVVNLAYTFTNNFMTTNDFSNSAFYSEGTSFGEYFTNEATYFDLQTAGVVVVGYSNFYNALDDLNIQYQVVSNYVALSGTGGRQPAWFLRTWTPLWKITVSGKLFGSSASKDWGIDFTGDGFQGSRTILSHLRTVFLWVENIAYWFMLWLIHIWTFAGGKNPMDK